MVFSKQPVARLQLTLFDSPLPISGFRLHSTNLFASGNVDIEHPFQTEAMKSHTPLLPFTDEVDSSEDELATGTRKDKSHALQNPRTWIDRAESRFAPKPAVQKFLDFDHESMGGHSAQPSSGDGSSTEASPARVERTSNIQPSSRISHGRTSITHGERVRFEQSSESRSGHILPQATASQWLTAKEETRAADSVAESHSIEPATVPKASNEAPAPTVATGDKAKAKDILTAIRVTKRIVSENRQATDEERLLLSRFGGFGPVALGLFPDPTTGNYKDATWERLGNELEFLLTLEEYESAKRTTFNAFYTSPEVIRAMHTAINRLGVGPNSTILEPGCGVGNFLGHSPNNQRFIGVELDRISGTIARLLYPEHDIRIENFRDTRLPEHSLDAVLGNVPFANIKLEHRGQRFALHDYFFAKSIDAIKPGGILALVTSHFTLDKQNASIREYLADRADFIGAIRLPAEAFKNEGTKVVTDIVFLRKRSPDQIAAHVDADWLGTDSMEVEGLPVSMNKYFIHHPEMVLGTFTRENQLYGDEGYSIKGTGNLNADLQAVIARLPEFQTVQPTFEEKEFAPARFNRPPPLKHLTEGSYFVGDDQTIYSIKQGVPTPATHGKTVLKANGTMMGQRLAALIGLRDAARLVLQAQNENWPEGDRDETRNALNQLYDRFHLEYGPINKTSFTETADGTVIRRMPNLAKFRDDPDSMLVLSLEDYDELTGIAKKVSIFTQDVVSRSAAIDKVSTAEEGLLVSLDQRGCVDVPFIEMLYGKPESQIIEELGDLIYLNPASNQWETADAYLSGNVREKLAQAIHAGPAFERNVSRLRAVQPPDVLPGDIDAKLGSPWIPEADLNLFAKELFNVDSGAIRIAHLKKDAVFSVDSDFAADQSIAATSEYGTPRANGIWLLELALNMKSPMIYDTIDGPNGEERVVNQEATLATKEKQKTIKEKFKSWIFADPERSERLVRLYNDTYNNLRLRVFDGSHLAFPGMNQTTELRPHQKNAIWRSMSSGNTLYAHTVGAGKTFTMAATGMKLKQAGLVKKPMFVVPNHMLEQFSREFMQLYPNARLLVANKDDMSRERRKFLTAKIASSEWDGIVVTHSSFERIGMSKEYQEKFLREQISEYEELLVDAASHKATGQHRNIIKAIEKQKAARENRLQELLAEDKKDDGLVFDELGVDHLFIDEAHYFKNLETPTKMERVAGIQTGGSQRSFDLYMKARYLDELHYGHGVTFATGTPISNTMVEMYNLQRFLDPHGLTERGIDHFDAWAATFGEVVDSMEISPDGSSLKSRSRFAKFNNLPELQQMFRSFADVQTAEMLNLPRPTLKGGKPTTVSCPMSESQLQLQQGLIERYDRIRSTKVDPRVDNALAITTDGRKLALDPRLLDVSAADSPASKLNALIANVHSIWQEHCETRGTQLIFCDMGVQATPWGYSVYDEIVDKLVQSGIPKGQIAVMGDADSDAKKQALFDRVRSGSIRVLLGSTQKMGTGTNVQKRLVALHHVDAPWKPAEVEQRDGRILRQGNLNEEVQIFRYVTQGSFDAYMWQALETKAKFIAQIMTGNSTVRQADDIGGQELSYAEVKAIASGNPAVLSLAEVDAELKRLKVLKKNHQDEQFLRQRKLKELPNAIAEAKRRLDSLQHDLIQSKDGGQVEFRMDGSTVARDDLFKLLQSRLESLPARSNSHSHAEIGEYRGLRFGLDVTPYGASDVFIEGAIRRTTPLSKDNTGPRAFLNAMKRILDTYDERIKEANASVTLLSKQLEDLRNHAGASFAHEDRISRLTALRDQLKQSLSSDVSPEVANSLPPILDLMQQVDDLLKVSVDVSDTTRTSQANQHVLELPITEQIRLRREQSQPTLPGDDVSSVESHVVEELARRSERKKLEVV